MKPILAATLFLIVAGSAQAQVYKCKGKDGQSVYSQDPCDASAQPLEVKYTKAATPTAAEEKNRNTVFMSTDLSDAAIAERNCLAAADSNIREPSNQRVTALNREIAALNARASQTRNNLAGATLESGIRTQIAGLHQSIATERASAEQQFGAARQRCADARAAKEQAIRERYKPAQ